MVWSMILITGLSFLVWVHHFFTMGSGPWINSVFSVTTMLIAIPTGVKIFNWLFTMHKGRIEFTTPMLWATGFIPTFLIAGITGVMLAAAAADYQFHNTYFLISHFHYALIGGTVFGCMAGLTYWWPKMFGHMLDERLGKWSFWTFFIGFHLCFFPQYILGFQAMPRRIYTYPAEAGWTAGNFISTVGAFVMGIGFLILAYNIYYSARYGERDTTGDPWNGRTLEWSIPSPAPHYNFARIPVVKKQDDFWYRKKKTAKTATSRFNRFICRITPECRSSLRRSCLLPDSGLFLNGISWWSSACWESSDRCCGARSTIMTPIIISRWKKLKKI